MMSHATLTRLLLCWGLVLAFALPATAAQDLKYGAPIPPVQRTMYERGCAYLVSTQGSDGKWKGDTGVTGICLMALLASGEDPNFGKYAEPVRKSIRAIIRAQSANTGFIRSGMYQHGFAMLALADAYGAVDERLLWKGVENPGRSIGESLTLAVRCAVTSQKDNPFKAWQYSPDGNTADTSAAGAVFMGLLGARNAGIAVPDESIDGVVEYYASQTLKNGTVNYSSFGMGDSHARSAICALVLSIAKRRDLDAFQATSDYMLRTFDEPLGGHPAYTLYYRSQALFQVQYDVWRRWTQENTLMLADMQADNGSIPIPGASHGVEYSTGMALLSTGLNYCLLPIYER